MCKPYFYGFLNNEEAEGKLFPKETKNGTFLVRLSTRVPGCFSITYKLNNEVFNLRIVRPPCPDNYKFKYRDRIFDSLSDCVDHITQVKGFIIACPGSPFGKIIESGKSGIFNYDYDYEIQ